MKLYTTINEFKEYLTESNKNNDFIVVDIQPEYQIYFTFDIVDFIKYINNNYDSYNSITFLYNGEDLGMISENDYINWLIDNGMDVNALNYIKFYEKNYGFFRSCMDDNYDESDIIDILKYMHSNDIHDSYDLNLENLKGQNKFNNHLLDFIGHDRIYIPDLIDELTNLNNIIITGGGVDECLKEVEILLGVLDKSYNRYSDFIY